MTPRIEFRNLCKRYPGSTALTINAANLQIAPGEFCVFVGPSGCGKSTLLRMVAGLEDVSSGELFIDGVNVNNVEPAKRGVAMVFQSYALYPHMTVYENMAFGLRVFGADKAAIDKKVRAAGEILQLTPLLDRLPKALSGGQRQRVAIGRAIVKEPQVFLFDEPLSNLDAALRVQTRIEIAKLHREIGSASMIYVTHDQVEAMTLADKIVLLHTGDAIAKHGSIAQVGSPMELYHHPASKFVAEFIGSPKMNVLAGTLKSKTDRLATFALGDAVLSAEVNATDITDGASIHFGIRPEHIMISPVEGNLAAQISGQIQHSERLGDSTIAYVSVASGQPLVTVKLPGESNPAYGTSITLYMGQRDVHLFDNDGRACTRTSTPG